jgi:hypothetical protein
MRIFRRSLRERRYLFQRPGRLEAAHELVSASLSPLELTPLGQHDPPAQQRQDNEEAEHQLGRHVRVKDHVGRR